MTISDRQSRLLNSVVEEYVKTAKPVSSQWLYREGRFDISPATIRIELGRLTDDGFLFKPHVSAGRVPTDKGYRFFVDSLREVREEIRALKELRKKRAVWEMLSFLTQIIAEEASTFALGGVPEKGVFFKEGWDDVLSEPEFEDRDTGIRFAKLVDSLQERASGDSCQEVRVFIGSENPFGSSEDFSLIISECSVNEESGILAIIGPKRMSYDKNIRLIKAVRRFLNEW